MKINLLRVGIVGCGGVAVRHAAAWTNIGARVTALNDINLAAAENLAEHYPQSEIYADYLALLDSGKVDVISICTPPLTHEEVAIAALQRGVHVLCEKPLAHTREAAQAIAAAQVQSQAKFMTAFRHRFLPGVRKMKEWIDNGRIGSPVYMNNTFCGPAFFMKDRWFSKKSIAGGGCMMDTTSHSVDLFRFLFGEIAEQHAVTHTTLEGIDVEDSSVLIVKSQLGVLGSLTATWLAGNGVGEIRVMGTQGEIVYDYSSPEEVRIKVAGTADWEVCRVDYAGGFIEEVAHFVDVLTKNSRLECTLEDGLRALEVIQGV